MDRYKSINMLMPLGTSPPTSSGPAVAPTSIDVLELAEVSMYIDR